MVGGAETGSRYTVGVVDEDGVQTVVIRDREPDPDMMLVQVATFDDGVELTFVSQPAGGPDESDGAGQ